MTMMTTSSPQGNGSLTRRKNGSSPSNLPPSNQSALCLPNHNKEVATYTGAASFTLVSIISWGTSIAREKGLDIGSPYAPALLPFVVLLFAVGFYYAEKDEKFKSVKSNLDKGGKLDTEQWIAHYQTTLPVPATAAVVAMALNGFLLGCLLELDSSVTLGLTLAMGLMWATLLGSLEYGGFNGGLNAISLHNQQMPITAPPRSVGFDYGGSDQKGGKRESGDAILPPTEVPEPS